MADLECWNCGEDVGGAAEMGEEFCPCCGVPLDEDVVLDHEPPEVLGYCLTCEETYLEGDERHTDGETCFYCGTPLEMSSPERDISPSRISPEELQQLMEDAAEADFPPIRPMTADLDVYLPFFVYGTLREGCSNHEFYLQGRLTQPPEKAVTRGELFMVRGGGFPCLMETEAEKMVAGEMIWVKPDIFKAVMSDLDRLEGYHRVSDSGTYLRRQVDVITASGKKLAAWAYFWNSTKVGDYIPNGDFTKRDSSPVKKNSGKSLSTTGKKETKEPSTVHAPPGPKVLPAAGPTLKAS